MKNLEFKNVLFKLLKVSFNLFCKILDIYEKYQLNLMDLGISCLFQILNTRTRPGPKKLQVLYEYFNYRPELTRTRKKPTRTRTENF